jgi:hypothetical protein
MALPFMALEPLGNALFNAPPKNPRENITCSVNHGLKDGCQEDHGGDGNSPPCVVKAGDVAGYGNFTRLFKPGSNALD